jgi:hypothetical protein
MVTVSQGMKLTRMVKDALLALNERLGSAWNVFLSPHGGTIDCVLLTNEISE